MGFETASFQAMGTQVELLGWPGLHDGVANRVEAFFAAVEARLSRFRPASELSRLNRSAGRPFRASAFLRRVLREALKAAEQSGGLYDPTVLGALEAAGYDRSLSRIRPVSAGQRVVQPAGYAGVTFVAGGGILLRDGVRVDLGGFAKGWTVDAAARFMRSVPSWVINAGGDLRAAGPGPDGEGWLVGIEDPWRPGCDLAVLRVRDRAVATSSIWRRRWRTAEGWAHHIIDPRTGRPAETGLASVTVVAPSAAQAEVLTKTVLLLGPRQGLERLESEPSCAGVLVTDRGDVLWSGDMEGLRAA